MRVGRKRRSSPKKDAEQIARALSEWLGFENPRESIAIYRKPRPGIPSAAEVTIRGEPTESPDYSEEGLELPLPTGRSAAIRIEAETPEGKRWLSVQALDPETEEATLMASLDDITEAYSVSSISGISVYVR